MYRYMVGYWGYTLRWSQLDTSVNIMLSHWCEKLKYEPQCVTDIVKYEAIVQKEREMGEMKKVKELRKRR